MLFWIEKPYKNDLAWNGLTCQEISFRVKDNPRSMFWGKNIFLDFHKRTEFALDAISSNNDNIFQQQKI